MASLITVTPVAAAPFRLSLSPASVRLTGKEQYAGQVKVTDSGSAPLHIQMSAIQLAPAGAHCNLHSEAPSWLHVSGAPEFTLKPGQARVVHYTVSADPGQTGTGAVVATATLASPGHGDGQISASAGSRVTLGTSAPCHVQAAPAPPASDGISTWMILIPLLVLVLTVLAAVIWRTRRRAA